MIKPGVPNNEHLDKIASVSMANMENCFSDMKHEDVTEKQAK